MTQKAKGRSYVFISVFIALVSLGNFDSADQAFWNLKSMLTTGFDTYETTKSLTKIILWFGMVALAIFLWQRGHKLQRDQSGKDEQ